jgi:hypothetical protein
VVTATGQVGGTASAPGGRFEAFGITPEWMKAYRQFWGAPLPEKLWGLVNPVVSLFSRYMQRLPQMDDWQRLWEELKASLSTPDKPLKHMPQDLAAYEPVIIRMVRQPLFTPPNITYSPTLQF